MNRPLEVGDVVSCDRRYMHVVKCLKERLGRLDSLTVSRKLTRGIDNVPRVELVELPGVDHPAAAFKFAGDSPLSLQAWAKRTFRRGGR